MRKSHSPQSGQSGKQLPGLFSLVLHTHLPLVNHHGRWPVGEEWLYQAWAESYIPLFSILEKLAIEGFSDILTLGLTPILADQLDDPYALAGMHHWLGNFLLRSDEAARSSNISSTNSHLLSPSALATYGKYSYKIAQETLEKFETDYIHGCSPVIRKFVDAGIFELLSGPLTHPFQPLLHPILREYALKHGILDTTLRIGSFSGGIWAPECAYTPGMEQLYSHNGITHFLVDGPAFDHQTNIAHPIADSSVIAFARNLEISYRVWSPNSGYPGHSAYRDFYTYDEQTGLKPTRVTGKDVIASRKQVYDPDKAMQAIEYHIHDFISVIRKTILEEYERTHTPVHIVAAFDTELFGHWWHEGPQWLEGFVKAMEEAGIPMGSLATALKNDMVGDPIHLGDVSWGTGKDFTVWNGPQVDDITQLHKEVTELALLTIAKRQAINPNRDIINDQILREALLCQSSDWAFLITKNTSAQYARERLYKHAHALREICYASEIGDEDQALRLSLAWRQADNPFSQLDARDLCL